MNGMNRIGNLYYDDKKIKQIRSKRTQKKKRVWGWILTVLGILELPAAIAALDAVALIEPFIFLLPGVLLLLSARRQVRKWDRYEAIIDNHGNTPISLIAKKMGLPEKTVYSDLQTMILSDFFIGPNCNIEAYVDAEHDMLVMASGGKPLRPIPDLLKEKHAQTQGQAQSSSQTEAAGQQSGQSQGQQTGKTAGSSTGQTAGAQHTPGNATSTAQEAGAAGTPGAAGASSPKEPELTALDQIRQAIDSATDEVAKGYLYGLEGSVRRIDERMQANPELVKKTSIKRLYKYYLPQILELIRKYQAPETPADLKAQIRDALGTSANALSNIEADLLERDQMDAEVDIEVLKNMFAQDGLIGRQGKTAAQPQAQTGAKAGATQAQTSAKAGATQAQAASR